MDIIEYMAKTLIKPKQTAGLSITRSADGISFNVVVLNKRKDSVSITLKASGNSLESLSEQLNPDIPVFLSIKGKGILQKKLEVDGLDKSTAFKNAFPNSKPEDFLITKSQGPGSETLSIIRKKEMVTFLERLNTLGINVLSTNIDKQHDIEDWSFLEQEQLEESLKLPLALALEGLHFSVGTEAESDIDAKRIQAFFYKKLFSNLSVILLAACFGLLLINGLLFTHFHSLNQTVALEKSSLDQKTKLLQALKVKTQLITDNRLNRKSRTSFYADRIALDLPQNISFTKVILFPEKQDNKKTPDQIPVFSRETIKIIGMCNGCLDVQQWRKTLNNQTWVVDIQIVNCGLDEQGNGRFELDIITKPDF
ncbi:MAG: hypothetical protein AAF502_14560 [Bacteroidota bacterium]